MRISAKKEILLIVFAVFCLLPVSPSPTQSSPIFSRASQETSATRTIPSKYGEIVYRQKGKGTKQLYIIGLEHRDSITGSNGLRTAKVQAEVYKIGEWLALNEELELLLPEGFFSKRKGKEKTTEFLKEKGGEKTYDIRLLEKRLSDSKAYLNAEMLLKENHDLRIRQVEDRGLYDEVYSLLCKFVNREMIPCDPLTKKTELDYMKEKRLSSMLQKIPEVIEEEFQKRNIKKERALFTIGLNHLPKIIEYWKKNKIEIYPPAVALGKNEPIISGLNLLKKGYGILVILPRSLADDREILEMTGVAKIISHPKKLSSYPPL